MTSLPSEVKAALRERIDDALLVLLGAYGKDGLLGVPDAALKEAGDKIIGFLQPEIERLVVNAEERGYRLGSQITLQDLLLSLPSELSTPKALKLLKEYTALLKTYADIKRRHDSVANGLLKDVADMHTSLTHPKQQEEKQ